MFRSVPRCSVTYNTRTDWQKPRVLDQLGRCSAATTPACYIIIQENEDGVGGRSPGFERCCHHRGRGRGSESPPPPLLPTRAKWVDPSDQGKQEQPGRQARATWTLEPKWLRMFVRSWSVRGGSELIEQGVPGVFRGVFRGCSGVFRGVPSLITPGQIGKNLGF